MVSEDKEEPVLDDKLLLVDDEKGILTMLENLLYQEGYTHITTVSSGNEALSLVETEAFFNGTHGRSWQIDRPRNRWGRLYYQAI